MSMSSVNPNPRVNQSNRGTCGGASCITNTLNAVGKWGTLLTGVIQGKPVATAPNGSVAIGARGATSLPGAGLSSNTMIIVLVIVAALIFLGTRH